MLRPRRHGEGAQEAAAYRSIDAEDAADGVLLGRHRRVCVQVARGFDAHILDRPRGRLAGRLAV
ncbi:hypothetical protein, partial [Burkholderia thailandensis]|uniref:hypothetical protein n=1 Tax=Burkholderia thailandensis TaxID=57975 RepID=UPI0035C6DC2E